MGTQTGALAAPTACLGLSLSNPSIPVKLPQLVPLSASGELTATLH